MKKNYDFLPTLEVNQNSMKENYMLELLFEKLIENYDSKQGFFKHFFNMYEASQKGYRKMCNNLLKVYCLLYSFNHYGSFFFLIKTNTYVKKKN